MLGQSREASFTELYSRYARDVYRFALYLSGDSKLAEDITSETFLRVWVTDTPIRLETVKPWLLTIVRTYSSTSFGICAELKNSRWI